jgi:hypothetical protein
MVKKTVDNRRFTTVTGATGPVAKPTSLPPQPYIKNAIFGQPVRLTDPFF